MLVSMGEALIDLVEGGRDENGRPFFVAQEGGSPFNVAMAMARLGARAGFLCPTSSDAFGMQLRSRLGAVGIVDLMSKPVPQPTALAVVSTDRSGHPTYAFHREGTADRSLDVVELCAALPESMEALHFGSLVLAQGQDWPIWKMIIEQARSRGAMIFFDPNVRLALIDDLASYSDRLDDALCLADLVKVSDEDLALLYPEQDPVERVETWVHQYDLRVGILTRGARGAEAWSGDYSAKVEESVLPGATVVDTVGAGDTFQGACIGWLAQNDCLEAPLSPEALRRMLRFATRAAGLNCLRSGCQPPSLEEVRHSLMARA